MKDGDSAAQNMAQWLRDRLRARDWNGSDLARALGVNTSTVSRWLRGVQPPAPTYCDRIADVFGVDADLVLTLAGHRPATEPLKPDDPRVRIISLLKRADLGYGRAEGLEAMLQDWIDFDRQQRKATQS